MKIWLLLFMFNLILMLSLFSFSLLWSNENINNSHAKLIDTIGFGTHGKKDAKECSCTLSPWTIVPEDGPTTEGDKCVSNHGLLCHSSATKCSRLDLQAILSFEKSAEILQKDEEEVQRPDLLSLVLIHHAQVHVLCLNIVCTSRGC